MSDSVITTIIPAITGIVGIILGTVLTPVLGFVMDKKKGTTQRKVEALKQQLEVYRPLYEKLVINADQDPEHYFSEWEDDEFSEWLYKALNLLLPNLHLLPSELLDKIYLYREITAREEYYDNCETEVKWLYNHIDEKFRNLRKQLSIE